MLTLYINSFSFH